MAMSAEQFASIMHMIGEKLGGGGGVREEGPKRYRTLEEKGFKRIDKFAGGEELFQ